MHVLNSHERVVPLPIDRAFAELEAMGTPDDRLWPAPKMPFRRTEGPLQVGVTTEKHGIIKATLDIFEPSERLVWRAELSFLTGTHGFELTAVDAWHTRVRHVLDAHLAWWFVPIWALKIRSLHDRIIEALFTRLEGADAAEESLVSTRPAPAGASR